MKRKFGSAFASFGLLTAAYIAILIYFDLRNQVFNRAADVAPLVVVVALTSLVAFSLRYVRWNWLLHRRGCGTPWLAGYPAYLAGFALTALPGKLGELVRIRYFAPLNVPASRVVACFFFERVMDLTAVLLLASLLAGAVSFRFALLFVVLVVCAILVLCRFSDVWVHLSGHLRWFRWRGTARLVWTLGKGLAGAATYFAPTEISVSLAVGLIAFGMQSLSFLYLTAGLGFSPDFLVGIAIFPLATLVGAASMVPGGIGTTEAATVVFLRQFGSPFEIAVLAAVGMRIGTLWFGIALGLIAAIFLEFNPGAPRLEQR